MTHTYQFKDGPLKVLCSSRARLTSDQRLALRQAYTDARISGRELPMNDIVMRDLLGSRDSLNIPVLLQLQHALDVEVITREELEDSFKSYLDYVYSKAYDTNNS